MISSWPEEADAPSAPGKPIERMNGTAIRRWHTYIGLLTAPSLIFFCLTGALQLFSLHEAHDAYRPYPLIEKLSSVHKDQVWEPHHDHDHDHDEGNAPPTAGEKSPANHADHDADHGDHDESQSAATLALKIFFLLISLGLTTSASLGVWIALTQSRQRKLCWILLISGTILPVLLVVLG